MGEIWIDGGYPLQGTVKIQGSKNVVLPMMAASILHEGITILHNCPRIADVFKMEKILQGLGVKTEWKGHTMKLDCRKIQTVQVDQEDAKSMRSSILLLGSMLARMGEIAIGYPGGCTIGKRPIDLHLDALKQMGANIEEREQELLGCCFDGLKGCHIVFPMSSVGATENALLAAVAAKGETLLENCAKEPEICHLCKFLQGMGAEIRGVGTGTIWIRKAAAFRDVEYVVPTDRIVAGTCLYAAAATRGTIELENVNPQEMEAVLSVYEKMGGQWENRSGTLKADAAGIRYPIGKISTSPYPGFPTDMQSVLMAVLLTIGGESVIEERIFEDRFQAAEEFKKMGAVIQIEKKTARISGGYPLHGARVQARELRGGAALLIAGMTARGETIVENPQYIERGYEQPILLFENMGARIKIRE